MAEYLDDKLTHSMFLRDLTTCENNSRRLNDSEIKFVDDMRDRYQSRQDMFAMGSKAELWNPTVKQINWLKAIADRMGR